MMKLLGVKKIVITNISGALNNEYKVTGSCASVNLHSSLHQVGDFVLIKDHINLAGLAGRSALAGENDTREGLHSIKTTHNTNQSSIISDKIITDSGQDTSPSCTPTAATSGAWRRPWGGR